jgi:hypothetical protein
MHYHYGNDYYVFHLLEFVKSKKVTIGQDIPIHEKRLNLGLEDAKHLCYNQKNS